MMIPDFLRRSQNFYMQAFKKCTAVILFFSFMICCQLQSMAQVNFNVAAAFSLRKIVPTYTGSAIQVRRSSDDAMQNIGFTACGFLDTAALKTFVGANNAFVATWYDQSGNGRNATQGT